MQGSRKTRARTTAPRPRRILNALDPTPAVPNESNAATITQAFNIPLVGDRCDPKPEQPSCTGTPSRPREVLQRMVRRRQLREMVPLADTTICEMEQRGEFPRRFYLTPRCAVWDASEI